MTGALPYMVYVTDYRHIEDVVRDFPVVVTHGKGGAMAEGGRCFGIYDITDRLPSY